MESEAKEDKIATLEEKVRNLEAIVEYLLSLSGEEIQAINGELYKSINSHLSGAMRIVADKKFSRDLSTHIDNVKGLNQHLENK